MSTRLEQVIEEKKQREFDDRTCFSSDVELYKVLVPYRHQTYCGECGSPKDEDAETSFVVKATDGETAHEKGMEKAKETLKNTVELRKVHDDSAKVRPLEFMDNPKKVYSFWKEHHPGPYLVNPDELFKQEQRRIERNKKQ